MLTARERARAETRRIRTPERLAAIDAHLRAWAGVSFAHLAADLGVAVDLLRTRARQIGAEPREV